jgi:serine/threonine-protein kinase
MVGDRDSASVVSPTRPRLMGGMVIGGTYRVEGFLGAGAFGDVYRVCHRFLGWQALKLIEAGPGAAPVAELLKEARVLATLSHPHVVRLFDADVHESNLGAFPYFTMEYIAGGTLRQQMRKRRRFAIAEALDATVQILEGVGAAHSLSPAVLHRDVTPRNVLVAAERPLFLKLSDFGLARHVDPEVRLVRSAGKIEYQPPEAARHFASETSDLYAVGLILYELLTGVPAFPLPRDQFDLSTGAAVATALVQMRRDPPEPPSTWQPEIPSALDELVMAVLAQEPQERLDSAEEFAAAAREVGAQATDEDGPASERAARPARSADRPLGASARFAERTRTEPL